MRVGAVQLVQRSRQYDYNLKTALDLTEDALSYGCELVVIPELFATGYLFRDFSEALTFSEEPTGKTFDAISRLAITYDATLVYGYVEFDKTTHLLHNSAAIVDKSGLVANYRKLQTYVSDTIWATDGNSMPPLFSVKGVPATVLICADAEFPELTAHYSDFYPKLICLPTAWVDEKCPSMTWWARTKESSSFMIAADLAGVEHGVQFSGGTSILAPSGDTIARIDTGSGWIFADIDLSTSIPTATQPLARSLFLSGASFSARDLSIRLPTSQSLPSSETVHIGVLNTLEPTTLLSLRNDLLTNLASVQTPNEMSDTLLIALPSIYDDSLGQNPEIESILNDCVKIFTDRFSYYKEIILSIAVESNNFITKLIAISSTQPSIMTSAPYESIYHTESGLSFAILETSDLISWSKCRDLSINGAAIFLVSMASNNDWGVVRRSHSYIPLPPYGEAHTMDTFNLARVRAGENNVAICVAGSANTAPDAIPSGLYGPDFFQYPYPETIFDQASSGLHVTVVKIDPKLPVNIQTDHNLPCILTEKSYLRRRKPWVYSKLADRTPIENQDLKR